MDFNRDIDKESTYLIKQFVGLVGFLMVLTAMAVGHYLLVDKASQKEVLSKVVAVTGFVSPSFSTAFYEPKVFAESVEHPVSPQMQSLNRMDFVYAE